ncbi:Anti-sigma regulatory factor (Ser/Thr protein kinase) [Actinacidiphila alni]|uniref:Anti-sigma regulatory factor (Ser/Thr protein kinase) n=1 Tax=Actinacidiphila alni TaxID=380248 RepID=A0A1I2JBM4_9ACTN|nr:ATP-binding protein [Actinacidiphila alni]SFF51380.1 Anti-sigma regulatory factor (Ser/Thr protein kinase) [Actinacidiphila alni]
MYDCPPIRPSRRCLLPFEADPQVVGELRHLVGLHLATWDAAHLIEAVTLAASELATNVIRHVGAGTPAALVLESREDAIRLEVHDTGGAMPHAGHSRPEDIDGRGLTLVSGVSTGWSAFPTPTGKTVSCEFARSTDQRRHNPYAVRGAEAVERYVLRRTTPDTASSAALHAADSLTVDLIADLLHWLAANGRDPDTVLDHAQMRFEAETQGEPDPTNDPLG